MDTKAAARFFRDGFDQLVCSGIAFSIRADQYSAGMLSRCCHDRTVWIEVPVSSARDSTPARRTMSE